MCSHVCSTEGEFEVTFDKSDLVHMDDALTVPATGGFYKTVAHHFYEVGWPLITLHVTLRMTHCHSHGDKLFQVLTRCTGTQGREHAVCQHFPTACLPLHLALYVFHEGLQHLHCHSFLVILLTGLQGLQMQV